MVEYGTCSKCIKLICSRNTVDGDCYVGDGSDYQGSANSTVSGKPCLVWSTFYDFLPSNNYCKNYFAAYGVTEPVCYIQPGSHYVEACGVRKCGKYHVTTKSKYGRHKS